VIGEWDLEEPPMLNLLFVVIEEDPGGNGPFTLRIMDAEQVGELVGFPVLSEDAAPEGCRAFTMQGSYQTVVFLGMCADGEYFLTVLGTDQDVVHPVMRDFVDGKPFIIPPGYEASPEFRRPDVWWVA
jgi:hypothetical protein